MTLEELKERLSAIDAELSSILEELEEEPQDAPEDAPEEEPTDGRSYCTEENQRN